MSATEIIVTLVALVAGYRLVTLYFEGSARPAPRETQAESDTTPAPEMGDAEPWYETLGVGPFATAQEVAEAYRRRIREYHPDKVAQMGPEIRAVADAMSKRINRAYEIALRRL